MSTGIENCTAGKVFAGSICIFKLVSVNKNLSGGVVELNVVLDYSGERNVIAIDKCTVLKCNRFISGSIAYILNCRKNSVVNSGTVVESNIVDIECVYRRYHRLNIGTDK